jgi:hypothetical protein
MGCAIHLFLFYIPQERAQPSMYVPHPAEEERKFISVPYPAEEETAINIRSISCRRGNSNYYLFHILQRENSY